MSTLDDRRLLEELYLPPADEFVLVDVPDLQFVMIDGDGGPDSEAFASAMRWIFAVVYPIKLIAKERMGKSFVEPPLECLWWADDMNDFIAGNRDKLRWRLMIVTADWVEQEMFDNATTTASERLGNPPSSLRLERFAEGPSVQIMHLGPNSEEAATLARLHNEFLPEHHLVANGHHHEIYLNDPQRVAPEKLKTVLRQPVAPVA
ncbi:MAG TPA: GyrI-like domain-containing protein [Acidimicrobiia bacterium]